MKTYIQIGAGAGDQDSRLSFRDGFSEYVKSLTLNSNDRIILVEPNPINIPFLTECWKNYPQAEIYPIGIHANKDRRIPEIVTFYYAEEDAPHYQMFSMKPDHVRIQYPYSEIKNKKVMTMYIQDFLDQVVGSADIEMLALDIEGIDADVVLAIEWERVNCNKLSIEAIHLGSKLNHVANVLHNAGFRFAGSGLDPRNYDHLYTK